MAPVPAQKKGSAGRVLLTIVILLALLAVAYYMWGDSEGLFDVSSLLTPWAQGWLAGGGR